jgi:hypothetical protein
MFSLQLNYSQLTLPSSRIMRWAGDIVRGLHWQGPERQTPAYLLSSEFVSFA